MNNIVLSIGSNTDDKDQKMKLCIEWLETHLFHSTVSKIYCTKATNGKDPDYLNAVLSGNSNLEFEEYNQTLKKYEAQQGRTPDCKITGKVPIDIDIVMWNNDIIRKWDFRQPYFQIGWNEINKS